MTHIRKRGWAILASLIIAILFNLLSSKQLIKPTSLLPSPTKAKTINPESVLVIEIVDGDTIVLENKKRVRLIGIDTPELHHPKKPVQCFAQEAKDKLAGLILGRRVRLEKDVSETDRYKRLLRYMYVDNLATNSGKIFINDYMVRNGYAFAATFPPDVKYVERFQEAQEEAKNNKRGLWSFCTIN